MSESEDLVRTGMQREILGYITIVTSPIGLDRLPQEKLMDLHAVLRQAVMWIKARNADELED